MNKWLLVNPDSSTVFGKAALSGKGDQRYVPLGLLSVGAELQRQGCEVKLIDLNGGVDTLSHLSVSNYKPDVVGIHSLISTVHEVGWLLYYIRTLLPGAKIVLGGAHATAVPEEFRDRVDEVIQGEFEKYHKLDDLSLPAYNLLSDPARYTQSRLICRKNPVALLETSRGCYGKCTFCDNSVYGRKMRFKSPERVMAEIRYVLNLGFREIQFTDAMFTADVKRVGKICELIYRSGLKFPWYPRSGIRVDRADPVLYWKMKQAGCYRLTFGCESGSQRILDSMKKEITLEQTERAVSYAKQAGLEAECFFIMGMPGETEKDLQATIDFALKIKPDYLKPPQFALPFPNTEMYRQMKANGQIHAKNWDEYHYFGNYRKIYDHDTLSWDVLEAYRDEFTRRVIKRPGRLIKAGAKALITGKWKAIIK